MIARLTVEDRETLLSLIGEGIHTGFRKAVEGRAANDAHRAIAAMPEDDWDAVLQFLVNGLELCGVLTWEEEACLPSGS